MDKINLDRMDLPQWYDRNQMVIMVVDPYTIYTYWELSFSQWDALNNRQLILRLYESNMDQEFESQPRLLESIILPPFTENWYFNSLQPVRRFQAELGFELASNNRFFSIIKSNVVEIPPAAPYTTTHQTEWQIVKCPVEQGNALNNPISKKVQELIQNMSFYMGINK